MVYGVRASCWDTSESRNARKGIKTKTRIRPELAHGYKSESRNARKGIKTCRRHQKYGLADQASESRNARKGIKTVVFAGLVARGKRQNQEMPVRALRLSLNRQASNANRWASESRNARKGIKTFFPGLTRSSGMMSSESRNARKGIKTLPIRLRLGEAGSSVRIKKCP